MPTWLSTWLPYFSLPFASALVVGLLRYVSPDARWTRQIKSDEVLLRDLPAGAAKGRLSRSIERQTNELLDYRELMSKRDKFFNWVAIGSVGVFIGRLVTMGPVALLAAMTSDPMNAISYAVIVPVTVIWAVFAVLGRGWTGKPARYYHDREQRRLRRQVIEYRASRVAKSKKIAA